MTDRIRFDLSGAATVEYALILALIFLVAITGMQSFAAAFQDLWTKTSDVIATKIGE